MKTKFNPQMFIIVFGFPLFFHSTEVLAQCFTTPLQGKDVTACACQTCSDPVSCNTTLYTHLAGNTANVACANCQTGEYKYDACIPTTSKKKSEFPSSSKK